MASSSTTEVWTKMREREREMKERGGEREKHLAKAISGRGAQTSPDCHGQRLVNAFEIEVAAGVPI